MAGGIDCHVSASLISRTAGRLRSSTSCFLDTTDPEKIRNTLCNSVSHLPMTVGLLPKPHPGPNSSGRITLASRMTGVRYATISQESVDSPPSKRGNHRAYQISYAPSSVDMSKREKNLTLIVTDPPYYRRDPLFRPDGLLPCMAEASVQGVSAEVRVGFLQCSWPQVEPRER